MVMLELLIILVMSVVCIAIGGILGVVYQDKIPLLRQTNRPVDIEVFNYNQPIRLFWNGNIVLAGKLLDVSMETGIDKPAQAQLRLVSHEHFLRTYRAPEYIF